MKKYVSKKVLFKIIWILFVFISIVVWVPQIDRFLTEDYAEISKYFALDDGWDITINQDSYQNVLLTEFQFPAVRTGDRITMQRILPSEWGLVEGVMRFYVRHNAVRMCIDDELIYEYGQDRLAAGQTLGSGYQFIQFPDKYQGKTLRIELVMAEDKVITKLDSIRIYECENALRALVTENRLPLFCGSFLIIFGLMIGVITTVALFFSTKYIRLFCIALFSMFMGLWSLSYYNVMQIFAIPLYLISLINYLALYLAPIPLIVYIHAEVANLKYRPLRIFYWCYLAVDILVVTTVILLHVFNLVHLAGVLKYVQGIMCNHAEYLSK